MISYWDNEIIDKMNEYYNYRQQREKPGHVNRITNLLMLIGDDTEPLKTLPANSIQLTFTSPPYYNAREYSDYSSYAEYLSKMGETFSACHRVLEDGRFIEELCRKVLRYYSFEGDAVLDPFAGSGTFGRAARKMGRIPVLWRLERITRILSRVKAGGIMTFGEEAVKSALSKLLCGNTVMKLLTRSTRYS